MSAVAAPAPQQAVRSALRAALYSEARELLVLIAQLRTLGSSIEPSAVRAQAALQLGALRARFAPLIAHGAEMFRFAELALIATLDEAGLARFRAGTWIELGPTFHCGLLAPAEVLRHMQQHLQGKPLPRELVEIYLCCLALGFRAGANAEQLQQVRMHLSTQLNLRNSSLFRARTDPLPPRPLPALHPLLVVLLGVLPLGFVLLTTQACMSGLDRAYAGALTKLVPAGGAP